MLPEADAAEALRSAAVIFEGVPEVLDLKREVFARVSKVAGPEPIIASTTSTILVDDLSGAVEHPERFLNAHWLNPAFVIPLVELSPGARTDPAVTQRLKALLEGIGKVPVVCAARPGYIVPRIQALAMNEAARMVEEGVASRRGHRQGHQVRLRLPLRQHRACSSSSTTAAATSSTTPAATWRRRWGISATPRPAIIERNMAEGRIGLKTGQGFLDYAKLDIETYRAERLKALLDMLGFMGLSRPPVLPE